MEAETDVVGGPGLGGWVFEDWGEEGDSVVDGLGAAGGGEQVEDSVAEGVEPFGHAVGERGGAGDEVDGLDFEAGLFEQGAVVGGGGVEAGGLGFGVDAEGGEGGLEGGADGGDVAEAAHLGDETGAGAEGAVDGGEGGGLAGLGDPVEGGVGEGGVEGVGEGDFGGVALVDFEAAGSGGGEHGRGDIDAGEDGAGGGEARGEDAVAAADVEDALAGSRGEEFDYAAGEVGDETAVGGVGFGVPGLDGGGVVRFHILILHRKGEFAVST